MKTIRTVKSIKGLALLGLGLGMALPVGSWSQAQAQPDPNNAAKAENPPNRARRNKGQKGGRGQQGAKALARMQEREMATAEEVAGKPLTDEQKQKVRDALAAREEVTRTAREKYISELAASLGMEPDAVRLKMREANAKRNGQGQGQGNAQGAGRAGRAGRRNRGGAGGAVAPAAGG